MLSQEVQDAITAGFKEAGNQITRAVNKIDQIKQAADQIEEAFKSIQQQDPDLRFAYKRDDYNGDGIFFQLSTGKPTENFYGIDTLRIETNPYTPRILMSGFEKAADAEKAPIILNSFSTDVEGVARVVREVAGKAKIDKKVAEAERAEKGVYTGLKLTAFL